MAETLMVVGLVMSAGTTIMGAISQGEAARAAAANSIATGEYNASVAELNAKLAMESAETATELARNRAIGKVQAADRQIGTSITALGQAGVLLEEGTSPLDAIQQIAADGAQASNMELYLGENEAIAKRNEARIYKSRAQQERWKGYADANAYLSKAPTALGTVLQVGGQVGMAVGSGYASGMFGGTGAAGTFTKTPLNASGAVSGPTVRF